MSTEDKIRIFDVLTDKYEVDPEVINMEWGIQVGKQRNLDAKSGFGEQSNGEADETWKMSDEEYEKRYGHPRNAEGKINFLMEG